MDEGWERWFLAWSGEVCVDVLAEVWRRMKVGEGWTSNCYTSGWTKWLPPPPLVSTGRAEAPHWICWPTVCLLLSSAQETRFINTRYIFPYNVTNS